MLSLLVLSLSALAQSPAFVFADTEMFSAPSTDTPPTRLPQTADLVVLASVPDTPLRRVRTADGQEGFVRSSDLARLEDAGEGHRYYLTPARLDGNRRTVLLVVTDQDGTLIGTHPGPASSGQRLHRVTDFALPGIDELLVIEAFRSSCPGGSTMQVVARVGEILADVTTLHSAGESSWHSTTELYRPVRDADGVLRFRHLLRDTVLEAPIIAPRAGVLVEVTSIDEPWGDQMGRGYRLRSSSQRVIQWSIAPGE